MVSRRRAWRVIQVVVVVVTIAAVTFLMLTEHTIPALGVGVAGIILLGSTALAERLIPAPRRGALSAEDQLRNLALVLKFAHAMMAGGLVMIAVGAILALTGIGNGTVAHTLLVWIGPYAIVGGLAMYASNRWLRGDLANGTHEDRPSPTPESRSSDSQTRSSG